MHVYVRRIYRGRESEGGRGLASARGPRLADLYFAPLGAKDVPSIVAQKPVKFASFVVMSLLGLWGALGVLLSRSWGALGSSWVALGGKSKTHCDPGGSDSVRGAPARVRIAFEKRPK